MVSEWATVTPLGERLLLERVEEVVDAQHARDDDDRQDHGDDGAVHLRGDGAELEKKFTSLLQDLFELIHFRLTLSPFVLIRVFNSQYKLLVWLLVLVAVSLISRIACSIPEETTCVELIR